MKRIWIGVVLFALFLCFSGTASAALFVDYSSQKNWFDQKGETVTWTFDLNNDDLLIGDINQNDDIHSAWLTVGLADDFDCEQEYAKMKIDGLTEWTKKEVDWGLFSFNVLSQVVEDHYLEVAISRISGDFGVKWMSVEGCYTQSAPVPEPATILLFGSGLLGLAGIGRKKMKKS